VFKVQNHPINNNNPTRVYNLGWGNFLLFSIRAGESNVPIKKKTAFYFKKAVFFALKLNFLIKNHLT